MKPKNAEGRIPARSPARAPTTGPPKTPAMNTGREEKSSATWRTIVGAIVIAAKTFPTAPIDSANVKSLTERVRNKRIPPGGEGFAPIRVIVQVITI
jgi:hypothetical protein